LTVTGPATALVVAHRGDWLEADHPEPQNSVGAVLSALEAGADGAEIDARLSADGTVVLHHDAAMGPADVEAGAAAPVGTPVCALADAELGHLATLAGLLDALERRAAQPLTDTRPGPVVLNIELKDLPGEPGWDSRHVLARRVAALLGTRPIDNWLPARRLPARRLWARRLWARPLWAGPRDEPSSGPVPSCLQVIVSSFDPDGLDHFRRYAPGTATALLLDEGEDWRYRLGRTEGLSAVNPAESMAGPELFAEALSRGLAVVPWTVDSPTRAAELAGLGAAAIITNRPRAVLAALHQA
jgi:glycerophosphoryl diester phosphodiesterase